METIGIYNRYTTIYVNVYFQIDILNRMELMRSES